MKYSVVNYCDTSNALDKRLDAEYWSPEALEAEKLIKGQPLEKYIENGYRVVYENTKIIDKILQKENNLPFFIQSSDIEDCCINMDTVNCVSNTDWFRYPKGRIKKGEILVEVKGNVKKVAIVTDNIPDKSLVSGSLYKLTLKNISNFFVICFLSCKYGQIFKNRLVCNIATPFINKEGLYNIPIPNFSPNVQNKIENLYKESIKLKTLTKILYKQSEEILLKKLNLSNWQPKHKLSYVKNYSDVKAANRFDAEYFQPKYDEIIEKIKTCKNGWDKLSDIIKNPKKGIEVGSEEYCETGIPFIRVSNLSQYEINDNNMQYISEKYYNSIAHSYQPQKGEILLSKDGTPGIAYYLNETPQKMIPSGGILRLSMNNDEYLPEYLTLVLNSIVVQMQAERVSSGALIKHWLVDEIQNTLIPKLEMSKQIEIVEQLKEAIKLRKQSKQLLEIAKRSVEIAIEENEEFATSWINKQLLKIGVEL